MPTRRRLWAAGCQIIGERRREEDDAQREQHEELVALYLSK